MRAKLIGRVRALEQMMPPLVKRTIYINLVSVDGTSELCVLTDKGLVPVSSEDEPGKTKQR
jgi:hypothetical protein